MKVAYVVNQYPKVSHSFIRREILAVERRGIAVQRIAMRGWNEPVVDDADRDEQRMTRHVLKQGAAPILGAVLSMLLGRPRKFAAAWRVATSMAKRSDRSLLRHLIYLAEACLVAKWVEASGATWLHAHFGTNSTDVAMLASTLTGIPYSFTSHVSQEIDRPVSLGLGEKIRRAAFAAVVCSFGRSQLYRWVGHEQWPKIHVVHCGLDELFRATPTSWSCDSPQLVCVGRLTPQKGQLLLLAALRRVLDEGIDCRLVLAGDGELRPAIEAAIADLRLAQHVRITGWASGEQIRKEILDARAFVLPSFNEGLPVAIMEAMAMSRPIISTYVAGIPELVLEGKTGWLVPAGDVEMLARAIKSCLAAPRSQLEEMGRTARARVLERHDIDAVAAQLAQLFGFGGGASAARESVTRAA